MTLNGVVLPLNTSPPINYIIATKPLEKLALLIIASQVKSVLICDSMVSLTV